MKTRPALRVFSRLAVPLLLLATARAAAPAASTPATPPPSAPKQEYFVFYGSPNSGRTDGISLGRFDAGSGKLTPPALAAQAGGPSFVTLAPDGKHLYACFESSNEVGAYAIDAASGALRLLNVQPSGGDGPCHISLDRGGKFALVANYNGGSVAVFPVMANGTLGPRTAFDQHTGKGPNADRQEGPHAHSIITDPANRFALCADLGNDTVHIYRFDARTGTLAPHATARLTPGAGPRHVLFSPNGKALFCLNELDGTLTTFDWDAEKGALANPTTVRNLPADFTAFNKNAELQLHPNGKFLYASARGHDAIAVFAVDATTSRLTLVQDAPTGGKTPRFFGFDPTGKWILCGNQDSNTVTVFKVDTATGKLTPTGEPVPAPAPICMVFFPVPAK
jgi:6-phosphogluconolactonase